MRDTALVHAAIQTSALGLYATSEQLTMRNDKDPWSPVPASPQTQRGSGVITSPQPEHHSSMPHPVRDSNGDDARHASNSSISFGLSPHDLSNGAHNEGQYHEYERHDDGNVERGFKFQLDTRPSFDSASDSRSVDDHG